MQNTKTFKTSDMISATPNETYTVGKSQFPVTAYVKRPTGNVPIVEIPQVTELKWHQLCLESRLKHKEVYREFEDVETVITELKRKIEECERKERCNGKEVF